MKPRRNQKGFVTAELIAGMALLLLPTALLVASLPTWVERQDLARGAARDAARSVALTADVATAQDVIDAVNKNYRANTGVDSDVLTLEPVTSNPKERCGKITVSVTVDEPPLSIPFLNLENATAFRLTQTHTEPVDPYRNNFEGGLNQDRNQRCVYD